jgi:alkanesulfonate monooxygenase SsuD/methylene tetrahydromethanopterin reductase-like flavin-dependent oxidoreductase (luciferase family)
MRVGLITPLHGNPDSGSPTWNSIRALAVTAERVGFDSFVFEDALLYRSERSTEGSWESMTIAAALAVATDRMHIGQSVVNSPYRQPALVAKSAVTLDEISGGRYILGIGAGNTADDDYAAVGAPKDHRYSRFAEAIEIIHSLIRTGSVDFEGEFYSARDSEMALPRKTAEGPHINIAGAGPKMLRLVAQFADAWNWWGYNETLEELSTRMDSIIEELETACTEHSRDSAEIERTIDVYSVVPPGMSTESDEAGAVSGSSDEIAAYLLGLGDLGFVEARCDLTVKTPAAVEAMAPVIEMVHAG